MRIYAVILLFLLSGCGVFESEQAERAVPARPVSDIVSDTVVGTAKGAWNAALTPLEDLNITNEPIPDKLQTISGNPYSVPKQVVCESINAEIAELNKLLGEELCTPQLPMGTQVSRKGEYVEQGVGMAKDQAIGIVSGKVSIIPFRGVVRKISGAEKHSKELEKAYQDGKLRRAFLRGLAASLKCECDIK